MAQIVLKAIKFQSRHPECGRLASALVDEFARSGEVNRGSGCPAVLLTNHQKSPFISGRLSKYRDTDAMQL